MSYFAAQTSYQHNYSRYNPQYTAGYSLPSSYPAPYDRPSTLSYASRAPQISDQDSEMITRQRKSCRCTKSESGRRLSNLGLVRVEIPGDGSCLFRAVADQILDSQVRHMELRKVCVEYIKRNKDDFLPFIDDIDCDFEEHLERMLMEGTWAGHVEIQALSLIFSVNFIIHSLESEPMFIENGFKKSVMLWYSHGSHFDSVYTNAEFKVLAICQEIVYDLIDALFEDGKGQSSTVKSSKKYQYKNFHVRDWQKQQKCLEMMDTQLAKNILIESPTQRMLNGGPSSASITESRNTRSQSEDHSLLYNHRPPAYLTYDSPLVPYPYCPISHYSIKNQKKKGILTRIKTLFKKKESKKITTLR